MINAIGPKDVTAADILGDSDVEIFNPDLHIATLEEKRYSDNGNKSGKEDVDTFRQI